MKSIHRLAMSSPRLKMAALAALMSMAVMAPAQAADDSAFDLDQYIRPGTLYVASGVSLLNTGFDCKDPNGNNYPSCTRPLIGGKMFGGYRMTPNLAVEVSFYYLGGTEVVTDQASVSPNYRRTSTRAQAIGFDWSNELFQVLNQHIRFGMARVATLNHVGYSNGTNVTQSDVVLAPYVGLGLSYQFNDYVRFYSGFDLLHTKTNGNTQVFWMGLGVEN